MRKQLLLCSAAMTAGLAAMAAPAAAAPWVRSFVVDNYEPAWHYGGKPGFTKGDLIDPGSDCPKGTQPILDYMSVIKTPWRTRKEVESIVNPPKHDLLTIHYLVERGLSYRGFRRDIESYINPFAAPDPGQQQVTGKIAEGFNLDGDAKTGGFTGPDGEKGIDNAYYRAWGCISSFRGAPYTAALSVRSTDKMLEGLYTMVIRMSGNKDPMNDDNVTFEVGYSPDHVIKQTDGRASADYSFRLAKDGEYTKLKATIRNGVVETEQVADLHAPRFGWFPDQNGDSDFHQGRIRLNIDANGNAEGLVGGYRDWRDLYTENVFSQSGGTQETREHCDAIGMYYALKRNADGMRDPKTGKNMGISLAFRIKAVPAYVIDPATLVTAAADKRSVQKYETIRAAFVRGVATAAIQPNPRGSSEGAPQLRQRPDGTWTNRDGDGRNGGRAVDSQPFPPDPLAPPKPGPQVSNELPGTFAAATQAQ